MKYLLDTHTVLWFFNDDEKLSENAKKIILNPSFEKYVSIVSAVSEKMSFITADENIYKYDVNCIW